MIALKRIGGGILAPDERVVSKPRPNFYLNGVTRFIPQRVVPVTFKRQRIYQVPA